MSHLYAYTAWYEIAQRHRVRVASLRLDLLWN